MMNIYIGTGLTHVPRNLFADYTSFLHELAEALRTNGFNVSYALVNSDPQLAKKPLEERAKLCYLWDRKMVEDAQVLIAEASFPSTGLGIEMQIAESKDIPILLCFKDFGINRAKEVEYENPDQTHHHLQIGEGFISLMALGLPSAFRTIKYENTNDGINKILTAINLLKSQ